MPEPMRAVPPGDADPSPRPGASSVTPDDLLPSSAIEEIAARAREQAEAQAAVADVMRRVEERAAVAEKALTHERREGSRLKVMLLLTLIAFNLYAWFGNPTWLRIKEPHVPSVEYYEASWKLAVYLERQRIEEYRREKGVLPVTAQQAGPVVRGVRYSPNLLDRRYQLAAGQGARQFVYTSSDTLSALVGRALLQIGTLTGGAR